MAAMATVAHPIRSSARVRRPARPLVRIALILATVAVIVGSFAWWIDRQVLNTGSWTETSAHLIANPTIRNEVSSFVVDEVFKQAHVNQLLGSVPDVGRFTPELKRLVVKLVTRELATPQGMKAWRIANRVAHRELLRILNGGGTVLSSRGGVVTLDLGALVADVSKRLSDLPAVDALAGGGLLRLVGDSAPDVGRIVIVRSTQLRNAQIAVKVIRGLAVVLPVAALVLFVLAAVVARGWRRPVALRIGWCLIAAGVCVLLARLALKSPVVDFLIRSESVRPAANAAWLIATTPLRDNAYLTIAVGAVLVVVAWLAGRVGAARGRRGAVAPGSRR